MTRGGPDGGTGSWSVVVADDDAVIRLLITRLLAQEPRLEVVAVVDDGAKAVDAVRTHRPDLCILDLDMPVLSGPDAIPAILRLSPATRILVATGSGPALEAMAIERGAHHTIAKTSLASDLLDAAFRLL